MKDLLETINFEDLNWILEGYWSIQINLHDSKKLENKIKERRLDWIFEVYDFIKYKIGINKRIEAKYPSQQMYLIDGISLIKLLINGKQI